MKNFIARYTALISMRKMLLFASAMDQHHGQLLFSHFVQRLAKTLLRIFEERRLYSVSTPYILTFTSSSALAQGGTCYAVDPLLKGACKIDPSQATLLGSDMEQRATVAGSGDAEVRALPAPISSLAARSAPKRGATLGRAARAPRSMPANRPRPAG